MLPNYIRTQEGSIGPVAAFAGQSRNVIALSSGRCSGSTDGQLAAQLNIRPDGRPRIRQADPHRLLCSASEPLPTRVQEVRRTGNLRSFGCSYRLYRTLASIGKWGCDPIATGDTIPQGGKGASAFGMVAPSPDRARAGPGGRHAPRTKTAIRKGGPSMHRHRVFQVVLFLLLAAVSLVAQPAWSDPYG